MTHEINPLGVDQDFILIEGGKRLVLTIHPNKDVVRAYTYIKNIGGDCMPGATTRLYRRARYNLSGGSGLRTTGTIFFCHEICFDGKLGT